jgi:hypothetical protein
VSPLGSCASLSRGSPTFKRQLSRSIISAGSQGIRQIRFSKGFLVCTSPSLCK